MTTESVLQSPDASARGFLNVIPDAARYGGDDIEVPPSDACEVPGIIRAWTPNGVRVLDIGCGTGAITVEVNRGKSNSVLCVEPDERRANIAAARGLEVICGVADERQLVHRGPFDVIVFSDVLEHLASPADIVDLAGLLLAPGGIIIASVPNVAHWTIRLKLMLGRFDYATVGIMDATHLRWFTRKTIESLFVGLGYRIVSNAPSAGLWLGVYHKFPFNLLPGRVRAKLIALLARTLPELFGCQHVVRAERLVAP